MHRGRIGSQRQIKVVAKIRQFGDRALLRQHFQTGHAGQQASTADFMEATKPLTLTISQ